MLGVVITLHALLLPLTLRVGSGESVPTARESGSATALRNHCPSQSEMGFLSQTLVVRRHEVLFNGSLRKNRN